MIGVKSPNSQAKYLMIVDWSHSSQSAAPTDVRTAAAAAAAVVIDDESNRISSVISYTPPMIYVMRSECGVQLKSMLF